MHHFTGSENAGEIEDGYQEDGGRRSCDCEGNTCVVFLGVEREAVDQTLGIAKNRKWPDIRVLDLHLDEEVGAASFPRLFAHVMLKLQAVLEAVQPRQLWLLEDGTVPSADTTVCAGMLHVPVRWLSVPQEQEDDQSNGKGGPETMSSILMEAVERFQMQAVSKASRDVDKEKESGRNNESDQGREGEESDAHVNSAHRSICSHRPSDDTSNDRIMWQRINTAWKDDAFAYYKETQGNIVRYNLMGKDLYAFDKGPELLGM